RRRAAVRAAAGPLLAARARDEPARRGADGDHPLRVRQRAGLAALPLRPDRRARRRRPVGVRTGHREHRAPDRGPGRRADPGDSGLGAFAVERVRRGRKRRLLHDAGLVVSTLTTERIHERARQLDAIGWVADITEEPAAGELVAAVLERWGRIDVLVNNAGMAQTGHDVTDAPLVETPYAGWSRQL